MAIVFLFISFFGSPSCFAKRLQSIKPGMTKTDVLVTLGPPLDTTNRGDPKPDSKVDPKAESKENSSEPLTFWIYPNSEQQLCRIPFQGITVAASGVDCSMDQKDPSRIDNIRKVMDRMDSDSEFLSREQRYCGKKPEAKAGCKILETCSNGAWQEICGDTPPPPKDNTTMKGST